MESDEIEIKPSFVASFFCLCGFALSATILLAILAWSIGGQTYAEKVTTELLTPLGLAWLLLAAVVVNSIWQRNVSVATFGLTAWLLLTLFGNAWVTNRFSQQLESEYQAIDPFQMDPLDILVVLGGGTNSRLSGSPQLSPSGDRVALAAQLYHAGLVGQIICSGTNTFQPNPQSLHCREEAQQILIRLGVPPDKILLIEGENTSQEMANLAVYLDEQGRTTERIGLLTSAWHLSRAMRLAERHELNPLPVPANFYSEADRIDPNWIVPGTEQLGISRSIIKEYVAKMIGR